LRLKFHIFRFIPNIHGSILYPVLYRFARGNCIFSLINDILVQKVKKKKKKKKTKKKKEKKERQRKNIKTSP